MEAPLCACPFRLSSRRRFAAPRTAFRGLFSLRWPSNPRHAITANATARREGAELETQRGGCRTTRRRRDERRDPRSGVLRSRATPRGARCDGGCIMPTPGLCRVRLSRSNAVSWGTRVARHNQRLLRNASNVSSGRNRPEPTFNGAMRESALSFVERSASKYICVVSMDS